MYFNSIMYNCIICQYSPLGGSASEGQQILMNENFNNLKDLSKEIGLTYQQVADLVSRPGLKKYQKFKFYPKITISKLDKNSVIKVSDE